MNHRLQKFARDTLKEGLRSLPAKNQMFFKQMYSHMDLTKPIEDVVDSLDAEKLDWAMTQVENTCKDYLQNS